MSKDTKYVVDKERHEVYLEFSPRRNQVEMMVFNRHRKEDGTIVSLVGKPIEFREYGEMNGGKMLDETLAFSKETAQMILDGFYSMGFRPTHTVEAHASLEAVNNHLQDMRTIVADKLAIPLPGVEKKQEWYPEAKSAL
jgi:hypothetical protein